jgi:hypothetical protein
VRETERGVASLLGARDAILVPSTGFALRTALVAGGAFKPCSVVIGQVCARSSWAAIASVGADPVVVPVDPNTLTLDPDAVGRAVDSRTGAILVDNPWGVAADTPGIWSRVDIPVIENGATATGSAFAGRQVGAMGEVGVVQFGSGIGGGRPRAPGAFLVTDDPNLRERIYRSTVGVRVSARTTAEAVRTFQGWSLSRVRAQAAAARAAVEGAGLATLVGGPERTMATPWIPVRLDADAPRPAGFIYRPHPGVFIVDGPAMAVGREQGVQLVTPECGVPGKAADRAADQLV